MRDVFEKLAEQSLNLMGWEIDNHWPLDLDQCVMIAAPHTSNWDALYARLALKALGVKDFNGLMPSDIFSTANIFSLKGLIFFVFGGFLVGFGTRWAGGCTSGHAIMGLSNLQIPSLIATIAFMVGGFASTHLILPFLLRLVGG